MSTMIANYLTVQEVAEDLKISEARVRQLLASGQLKGDKPLPKLWLIQKDELKKFKKIDRPNGVRIDRRKGA